ncbi:MAG: DegQ family serine endoprotease [Alphaproteobacteria bacterium]|nr:DegQ family serine endoprotease [Alphaproteobacteria bacterium]
MMRKTICGGLIVLVMAVSLFTFTQAQAQESLRLPASGPSSFADLVETLLPSVVNISTTQKLSASAPTQDFDFEFSVPEGSPFENFFEEFKKRHGQGAPDAGPGPSRRVASLGSGFVIDPAGYIVTNYHVVQDAEEITVILQDDTNLTATIVGKDKKTDLAVIKVNSKKPLTPVTFGDSDKVRVGDWIVTVGNPFGLGGSVTTGIISARARDINSGPYDDYLQTDAPINRGNSGGPMFNMKGEVIGINTAIYTPSGGSVGIGFAIPSAIAKGVIEQLKTVGFTKRGWLGVRIQLVTPEIAESLGLDKPRGALVSSLTPGGPAAKAKLEVGDVILTFDGRDIPEMHRLPRIVADTPVGKTVAMTVLRKGREINLKATVEQLAADDEEEAAEEATAKQAPTIPQSDMVEELGLGVSPVSAQLRKRYQLGDDVNGLVVVKVTDRSIAAENGIRPGDVISEAGQQEVKTVADLRRHAIAAKNKSRPLLILLDRKGDLRFLALSFEKNKKKDGDLR